MRWKLNGPPCASRRGWLYLNKAGDGAASYRECLFPPAPGGSSRCRNGPSPSPLSASCGNAAGETTASPPQACVEAAAATRGGWLLCVSAPARTPRYRRRVSSLPFPTPFQSKNPNCCFVPSLFKIYWLFCRLRKEIGVNLPQLLESFSLGSPDAKILAAPSGSSTYL